MIPLSCQATVHGAISIVNAIATGKGSALGISLKTTAKISLMKGEGKIIFQRRNNDLFTYIIDKVIPKQIRKDNDIRLSIYSEIPIGFGLKSSSAVSSAVSLACYGLLNHELNDFKILNTAVESCRLAKVTMTGAFDDSTACYFGGFVLTDNYSNTLLRRENGPEELSVIILIPNNVHRKNILKLKSFPDLFNKAFELAEQLDYWTAMKLNGALVSSIMSYDYEPIIASIESGALSASVSGNGPSVAAIVKEKNIDNVKVNLEKYGRTFICKVNNRKATVERIFG